MNRAEPTCGIPSKKEMNQTCRNAGRKTWKGGAICTRHFKQLQQATPLEE